MAESKMPKDFLRTVRSLENFTKTLHKIRAGAEADANIELNRDECQSLIWAMALLRVGPSKNDLVEAFREEDDDGGPQDPR